MSAEIIIHPAVRVERAPESARPQKVECVSVSFQMTVSGVDYDRLRKFARECRLSPEDSARAIVSAFLNPKSGNVR